MSLNKKGKESDLRVPRKNHINLNPMRRWFDNKYKRSHKQVSSFVADGWVVADLGCNTGYYTFGLSKSVGPEGKVVAVELDEKNVQIVKKEIQNGGFQNVDLHKASVEDLNFIENDSMEFVLANGLLCEMIGTRKKAVEEIKRILKPDHYAFLSLGTPPPLGKVSSKEWESILEGFEVYRRGGRLQKWAIVSLKK